MNHDYPSFAPTFTGQPPASSTKEHVDDYYGVRDHEGKVTKWLRVSSYSCTKPTANQEEFNPDDPHARFGLWLYRKRFKNGRRRLHDRAKRAKERARV